MKKSRTALTLLCVICMVAILSTSLPCFALNGSDDSSKYVYTVNIKVTNPCNSSDMDRDAVNVLYFDYYYSGLNGFQDESKETFDMSWSGNGNKNSDFLNEHFIRSNDNSYNTSYEITLNGKLNRIYIKLNMDGGERLSFTVESVYCNGIRINSNTDYVSSAYNDSTATVYCSMEKSVINEANSPYFEEHNDFEISETEMNAIINGLDNAEKYTGQFKDQYNSVIDTSVLKNCIEVSDGDINQYYSHHDEESMYEYTFYFNVENPINLTNADYDEVKCFYIEMKYIDQNGYGSIKTYKLDMSYNSDLKRNLNQSFLDYFEANNDNGYNTHFSVWVPGIITEVNCKLNMSGEKLIVNIEKITLNSIAVNTTRDYVSSKYFDSDAKIKCSVPASQITVDNNSVPETYSRDLTDQYGAIISETLYNNAKNDPQKYLYHQ
jgi:hypothetical protein